MPSPFAPALAIGTDYLHTATDLHFVVAGQSPSRWTRGHTDGWHAKVRGSAPEDGATVGVAFYDVVYETKAEATARARQLLAHVKKLRAAGG